MARKRYTTDEIIRKLRKADVLIGQGQTMANVIQHLWGSDVTYYRWRKEYGGVKGLRSLPSSRSESPSV